MTSKYDFAIQLRDELDVEHETMVDCAREARQDEMKAKQLEVRIATMPASDPRRAGFVALVDIYKRSAARNRYMVGVGRKTLDSKRKLHDVISED
jgi:hypothetical protein